MPLEVTGTYGQEIGDNENVNWMESEFSVCHGVVGTGRQDVILPNYKKAA